MEKTIEQAVGEKSKNGKLVCKVAWEIASELDVPVREVGDYCNNNDIKIVACELGCF